MNSSTGTLYRVNPSTGEAAEIDLGTDDVTNGDGILLDGKILYVVLNTANQIAVIQMDPGFTTGEIVNTLTTSDFRVPTTVTEFGNALYAVNARFGAITSPSTEYGVVKASKK